MDNRTLTPPSKPRRRLGKELKKTADLYALLIPVIIFYFIFEYLPMSGLLIAFKDYNIFKGVLASDWVGLDNFRTMLQLPDFYDIVRNTLVLNLLTLLFAFPAPIVLALLLNEIRATYFKRISQSILYLPHFMSWIVLSGIIYNVLSPQYGFVNVVIRALGFDSVYFMVHESWWVVIYVLSEIWHSAGWGTIIYLAALSAIDPALYEAAVVDGAGRWKKMIHITLPGLLPTIVILLILHIGHLVSIGFEHPFALANAAVSGVADVISTYTYVAGIKMGNFSLTTAIGFVQSAINLLLILGANQFARKLRGEGLW